jgi:hypothetical protein
MEKENLFSKEKLEELAKAFYDEYLKHKELEEKLQKEDSELFEKYQAVNGKEHRKEKNALWEECNRVNVEEIFPLLIEKMIYSVSIVLFKIYLKIVIKTKNNPTTQPLEIGVLFSKTYKG